MALFIVMAYAMVVMNLVGFINYFTRGSDVEVFFSVVQLLQNAVLTLVNVIIIIKLNQRKNSVKYALAAQTIVGAAFSVFTAISEFNDTAALIELLPTLYLIIGIFLTIVCAWLNVKIYIEYIDNFERPKFTLTN